jgi:hypothetical protein
MAELESLGFESGNEATNNDADIEWLDFEFVKNCEDLKKLKSIYATLKTGRQGQYPQVIYLLFDCLKN